jgi:RNA polymerase sigma-70 factor (ECF subfamily)
MLLGGEDQPPLVRPRHLSSETTALYTDPIRANQFPPHGVWQLYGEAARRTSSIVSKGHLMQELVLPQPGYTARKDLAEEQSAREAADIASREEFESLLADAAPLAFRVARGVLHNSADAEDVAQEALLRAYRRFDRLRDRQRFRGWIVRIAFRLALDRTRSAKRRELRETLWSQTTHRPSTEDLAASSEFQTHLETALEGISEKYRLVLLLSAMEGHTLEEVAALLGVPLGTVKSRLFFARKHLAEKLRCHVNLTKTR